VQKLTVREAAENLGISEDAVRKRIHRGTLAHHRSSDGHVYVYMDNHAGAQQETSVEEISATHAIVTNDNSTARDQPPSWTRRIILIVVVSGVLAVLAALAWPIIENPSRLAAVNLSRFWVAIIVAATFSTMGFLVYFVANKTLWQLLEILIVPLALAIIGFGFTTQQEARQAQQAERALALQEEGAQNAALQAYLDQMSLLMLEKDLPGSEEGDAVFTLAQARTITVLSQLNEESGKVVSSFLFASGLLWKPALLAGADLENAELPKVALPKANLADANLRGANLTDAVLIDADFSATEKVGEDTIHIHMPADLTRADLTKAALQGANLSGCPLKQATLTDATLQSADLSSADLQGADLSHAALQAADLSSAESTADLRGAPLRFLKQEATNLTDADLSHAALQHADLSSVVLQNANLTNANLTDANLTDAYLSDAYLSDAYLYEASLSGANLSGANLRDAVLKNADLSNATLLEADLRGADLRGAKGVTKRQLEAEFVKLENTIMPDGSKHS
jgi:excisionase family DNA binding protein